MSEHSLSVTLKAGRDFDAPWVVVYGDTPDEVQFKLDNLEGVLKSAVSSAALLRNLHTLESGGLAVAEVTTAPAAPAAPAQPQGWGQPAQQQAPAPAFAGPQNGTPHPEGLTCPVDGAPVVFKRTTPRRSDGKVFEFWTCPNQKTKGDGHFSRFAD